jgi:nicotinamidase-related amidase
MTQALLIVDIQNDYFPGGKMELVGAKEAANEAARLLAAFRGRGAPVFHMRHVSTRPGATFFLPDTEGVKIHESVAPLASETVIVKHFPNSFRETRLLEALRAAKIERLAIAGMMTHMCIDATTRSAADLGFDCP